MAKKFIKYMGENFGDPQGIGGVIFTKIMNIFCQMQYKTVLENINLELKDNVLDIGFGNGYLIKKLLRKNIIIKIFGIDISNDMKNKVSKKLKQFIEKQYLKLSLEDIQNTSFENETFNKIYTVNTIYFWKDLDKCFSEIKRIIKSNGIFINVIYTKEYLDKMFHTKYGYNKYTFEEIKNITEKNGMEILKIIEIKRNKSYCIISKK